MVPWRPGESDCRPSDRELRQEPDSGAARGQLQGQRRSDIRRRRRQSAQFLGRTGAGLDAAQRWSFEVQQQLPASFMVEASYVGNRGTRLPVNRNINFLPAKYMSTSPIRDQATIDFLGAQFASPFFGLNPQYTSTTASRSSLLLPYPQFGNVTYADPVGYSWYHSLQSRMEKRFNRGFTLQMSYTWSKAMDAITFLNPSDPNPYESLSDIDRGHRITGSGIWELPFGKGRRFGTHMPRVLDLFAGGW